MGINYLTQFPNNRELAVAFRSGLREALRAGADVIVKKEPDDGCVASLVLDFIEPNIAGEADVLDGDKGAHEVRVLVSEAPTPTVWDARLCARYATWGYRARSHHVAEASDCP